jgi:hypothetical protein
MYLLSKALPWLIIGVLIALLVTQGVCLGVLLGWPQPVRDLDPKWKTYVTFFFCSIILNVVSLWRFLDFTIRSKPPDQSDFFLMLGRG